MTIAALRALIDAELPDIVRHTSPRWRGPEPERTDMTAPSTEQRPVPQLTTIKDLLAWGDRHTNTTVRRHAEQARTHLDALREAQRADTELVRLATEEADLVARLADVRERKVALRPVVRRSPTFEAAVVRAWARAQGIDCPGHGRVPKDIVAAWREQHPTA